MLIVFEGTQYTVDGGLPQQITEGLANAIAPFLEALLAAYEAQGSGTPRLQPFIDDGRTFSIDKLDLQTETIWLQISAWKIVQSEEGETKEASTVTATLTRANFSPEFVILLSALETEVGYGGT